MTHDVSIRPDFVGEYENAFRAGRSLAQHDRPPQSAPPAEVRRRAEIYVTLGSSLLGRPYQERRAILAHLAPALAKEGLSPVAISKFDPTDKAIAQSMRTAQAAGAAPHRSEAD